MNDAIIVSFGFTDLLRITIPVNKPAFDRITVVTTLQDRETQDLCKQLKVNHITTDAFTRGGQRFNKGAAYNVAFNVVKPTDWVTLIDSDILVSALLRREITNLDKSFFYGARRKIIFDEHQLVATFRNPQSIKHLKLYRGFGYGFFQLFNVQAYQYRGHLPSPYPEPNTGAGESDWMFRNRWGDMTFSPLTGINEGGPEEVDRDSGNGLLRCLPFSVLHLGHWGSNAAKNRTRFTLTYKELEARVKQVEETSY